LYTDIADATTEMIGALLAVTEKYGKEHIERCALRVVLRVVSCRVLSCVLCACRVAGRVRDCWLTLGLGTPRSQDVRVLDPHATQDAFVSVQKSQVRPRLAPTTRRLVRVVVAAVS
jgi:pyrimidine deaminase RibD-like protein